MDLTAAVTLAEDYLAVHPRSQTSQDRPLEAARPTPAPRKRGMGPPHGPPARPSPMPRANPLSSPSLSQGPAAPVAAHDLQGAPRTLGQECWRCGRPGHCRRDCPLMEVGQVIRVAGSPTPSPGPGATYCVP
ncbi:translation initiation factor IF-2-like [Siniperca chuatsi]|uniref:translation initiation factor IF-2-like n=1 Tax=Siniperca chuatsi TaxID=119488 RepID=UPI001CE0836E|nr:translation initiation factor IF-2-like [Siniperca chuatsi]